MNSTRLTSVLTIALMLSACGGATSGGSGEDANDSVEMSNQEAALAAATTSNAEAAQSGEDVAESAAKNANKSFAPADCVTATREGNTVTYKLDHCTGPFGYVATTGTIDAVYTVEDENTVTADITGDDLQVNQATMNLDATADYEESGEDATLDVETRSTGETQRGKRIERTGTYTVAWTLGSQCRSLDGNWETSIGRAAWTTDVTNYEKCKDKCPADGGKVVWTGERRNRSLTVEFDGDTDANWENDRGRTGTVDLVCGG